MNSLNLRIWGMTLSKMNDLSTLGLKIVIGDPAVLNNSVIVEAGDDDAGMSVVFHGTINAAWADFQSMPDCAFHVTANSGMYEAAKRCLRPAIAHGRRGDDHGGHRRIGRVELSE